MAMYVVKRHLPEADVETVSAALQGALVVPQAATPAMRSTTQRRSSPSPNPADV